MSLNPQDLVLSEYMDLLEQFSIEPNFWCSVDYCSAAGWKAQKTTNWISISDGDEFMLPTLSTAVGLGSQVYPVWAMLDDPNIDYKKALKFLDYEYIYDPKSFHQMEGKSWSTFRKNVRKFPKRYPEPIMYQSLDIHADVITDLLINWLSHRPEEEEIQDFEVMQYYITRNHNRKILIDEGGKMLGINVWDSNYKYTNYRYCICDDIPFLSEYMRWLFYTDETVHYGNKLVHDGGILDNPNLRFFKDKLNPLFVRTVNSLEASR